MSFIGDYPSLPGGFRAGDVVLAARGGQAFSAPAPLGLAATDVRAFGAKGDGINDDTVAIQAALNAGDVDLSAGTYLWHGALTIPARRRLTGRGGILKASGAGCFIGNTNRNGPAFATTPWPATSPSVQTDADIVITGATFDFTAVGASGVAASFFFAARVVFASNTVLGALSAGIPSGVQFIGCTDCDAFDNHLYYVINGVDTWKGSRNVRAHFNRIETHPSMSNGNGGAINLNAASGQYLTDVETAYDLSAIGNSIVLNGTTTGADAVGIFFDALSAGASTKGVTIALNRITAATGTNNAGIVGRGNIVAPRVVDNDLLVSGSGAFADTGNSSPITVAGFTGYSGTYSGTNNITTTANSTAATVNVPGTDVEPGGYLNITAALAVGGVTFAGFFPVSAVVGSVVTVTLPSPAPSGATGGGATTAYAHWGVPRNGEIAGNYIEGASNAGSSLVAIGGPGHDIRGIRSACASAGYGAILYSDPTDPTTVSPLPCTIADIMGPAGTGIAGAVGNGRVAFNGLSTLPNARDQSFPFSPQLQFGGASSGMAATVAGQYTLSGNRVEFQLKIAVTAKGTATGNATIALTGLPAPDMIALGDPAMVVNMSNMSGVTTVPIATFLAPGQAILSLLVSSVNNPGIMQDTAFTGLSNVSVSGFYFTS